MLKKVAFYILIIVVILSVPVIFLIMKANMQDTTKSAENKEFSINRIKYYSSANAISNTTNYQNPEWNLRVYQYTDIAIYLDRLNEDSAKNYITGISLRFDDNLENLAFYYLNPKKFGNSDLNADDLIAEDLVYAVINSSNFENEQNYNIPIFFQDCSNPITIRVVNNLSNNYTVPNDTILNYNGKLIKELGFGIRSLNKDINFNIEINTKDGNKRTMPINLEIPFEDSSKSILDGDFEKEISTDIRF